MGKGRLVTLRLPAERAEKLGITFASEWPRIKSLTAGSSMVELLEPGCELLSIHSDQDCQDDGPLIVRQGAQITPFKKVMDKVKQSGKLTLVFRALEKPRSQRVFDMPDLVKMLLRCKPETAKGRDDSKWYPFFPLHEAVCHEQNLVDVRTILELDPTSAKTMNRQGSSALLVATEAMVTNENVLKLEKLEQQIRMKWEALSLQKLQTEYEAALALLLLRSAFVATEALRTLGVLRRSSW